MQHAYQKNLLNGKEIDFDENLKSQDFLKVRQMETVDGRNGTRNGVDERNYASTLCGIFKMPAESFARFYQVLLGTRTSGPWGLRLAFVDLEARNLGVERLRRDAELLGGAMCSRNPSASRLKC